MLSLKESLKILKETNALIEGHFILSSGLHSSKYVQCAQLMSKPNQAIKICESLASKIKNEFKDFDLILSPAMGGIPDEPRRRARCTADRRRDLRQRRDHLRVRQPGGVRHPADAAAAREGRAARARA